MRFVVSFVLLSPVVSSFISYPHDYMMFISDRVSKGKTDLPHDPDELAELFLEYLCKKAVTGTRARAQQAAKVANAAASASSSASSSASAPSSGSASSPASAASGGGGAGALSAVAQPPASSSVSSAVHLLASAPVLTLPQDALSNARLIVALFALIHRVRTLQQMVTAFNASASKVDRIRIEAESRQ